jgi:predicted ATPase/class 3 adenylate cyclase
MTALPTGTVTFLYTDIEGSTRRWEERPAATRSAVDRHFALLRDAIGPQGGHVFRTQGDGLCAAFATAPDAVAAALSAQRALYAEPWPEADALRVRMALHTGAAEAQDGDYVGACLNRISRLLGIGHGGQTLVSRITYDLVRETPPAGAGWRDLGVHRLRDLAAPEQVFQLLHPDLPEAFPPLKSLDARPNNLPLQLTSFVGREREVAEVERLLGAARLLTLTGAGGIGKTRVALQVAADLLDGYPHGAWFVDLAPLVDEALVPQVVLAALALREAADRLPLAALVDHLRSRTTLLVLDNCEHLVDACARLVDALLRSCAQLTVLTTSREVLGVAGETVWPVPSLALPAGDGRATADPAAYDAVRLFVERAAAARPGFALTVENAPAVDRICRRLDGIPLALELAAARVGFLTPDQIAERLGDHFHLLTGGSRTALPRHRTLRALIDWSHELLDENERALLRRLAVFAGGWTLEAAEAVCAGHDLASHDALEALGHLVDKSLVVVQEQDGEIRYRLLETVRQYAGDRLREAGEAAPLRDRHRDWFLALAERAAPELKGRDQHVWLARLGAEHDNLRAALAWAGERGAAEAALRLAAALAWFWHLRSHLTEGRRWLDEALARTDALGASHARARALYGAGVLAWQQGDNAAARGRFEESRSVARVLGDKRELAYAVGGLGMVADMERDVAALRARMEESLALFEEIGDDWGRAWHLIGAGLVQWGLGDVAGARACFEESLASFQRVGDRWASAVPLSYLGRVASGQGELMLAGALFEQCLAIWREAGDRNRTAEALTHLGGVALRQADHEAAVTRFRESLVLARELGLGQRKRTALALGGLAAVAVAGARGQLAPAARLLGAADALFEAAGAVTDPHDRAEYDRDTAALRSRLEEPALAAAWAAGRAMTPEQSIADALEEMPPEQPTAPAGSAGATDGQPA